MYRLKTALHELGIHDGIGGMHISADEKVQGPGMTGVSRSGHCQLFCQVLTVCQSKLSLAERTETNVPVMPNVINSFATSKKG